MNIENRYPVTASLFMLKEIKHKQEQVNRGYQLLKRKAEALRFMGRQKASELGSTQLMLGHIMKEAYISLAAIKFTNGDSNALMLENIGQKTCEVSREIQITHTRLKTSELEIHDYYPILIQAQVRVRRITENISGVSTVSLQALEETDGIGDCNRYAGLGSGGHRTAQTKKAFREAVRILIKFASLRSTCMLLDGAIRSTLRKVNGIEKVIMPKLRNTESYIMTEMDEREREEFHRLKMLKAKKVRTQARLLLRQVHSASSAGISLEGLETPPPLLISCRSIEYLTGILTCGSTFSLSSKSGDYNKPICYPHNWDDDDLLFN